MTHSRKCSICKRAVPHAYGLDAMEPDVPGHGSYTTLLPFPRPALACSRQPNYRSTVIRVPSLAQTPDDIVSNPGTRMPGMGRSDGSSPYGNHVRFLSNIKGPLADLTRNALWFSSIVGALDTVAIPGGIKNPRRWTE